jgi:hypothetical protein
VVTYRSGSAHAGSFAGPAPGPLEELSRLRQVQKSAAHPRIKQHLDERPLPQVHP